MMLTLALALQAASPAEAWLVQVRPGARRYFHDSENGAAFTRSTAYVVPGDRLVATATRGGFTSVTFIGADGRPRTGWIESAGLVRAAPAGAWNGNWKGWNGDIAIKPARRGMLHLEGSASWGGHDPARVERGGVNIGDFSVDVAVPRGETVAFSLGSAGAGKPLVARPYAEGSGDPYRCRVQLRVLGPYLLARDNNQCGGHNVTFTGTYRLQARR